MFLQETIAASSLHAVRKAGSVNQFFKVGGKGGRGWGASILHSGIWDFLILT